MRHDRRSLLRAAMAVSMMSVVWGGATGLVAVWTAVRVGSVSLVGYGANAAVDAAASLVLMWRFAMESRNPTRADAIEARAQRIVGYVLIGVAILVIGSAGRSLLMGRELSNGRDAIWLLAASVLVLPPLAVAKQAVARSLASKALRADAFLSVAAAVLAATGLIGVLVASAGVAWADPVAGLLIAGFIGREGRGLLSDSAA